MYGKLTDPGEFFKNPGISMLSGGIGSGIGYPVEMLTRNLSPALNAVITSGADGIGAFGINLGTQSLGMLIDGNFDPDNLDYQAAINDAVISAGSAFAGTMANRASAKQQPTENTALGQEQGRVAGATKVIDADGTVRIIGEGDITSVEDNRPYLDPRKRPSYRKGVPETVWENARQRDIENGGDGTVRDPNTDEVLDWHPGEPRRDVWDMGHLPEQKYSDVHQQYVDGEMSPQEFRDWYNTPEHYRPEKPGENRSHKYESVSPPNIDDVKHAVGSAGQAQSVLNGIDPKYFNPESRFGGGMYVGADAETLIAELAEHGNTAKYSINYDMNTEAQNTLDLTNPQTAASWGYEQNVTSTSACQAIGESARSQGYTVIKFQSYRGPGVNYVIFDNFDQILSPRIVVPID